MAMVSLCVLMLLLWFDFAFPLFLLWGFIACSCVFVMVRLCFRRFFARIPYVFQQFGLVFLHFLMALLWFSYAFSWFRAWFCYGFLCFSFVFSWSCSDRPSYNPHGLIMFFSAFLKMCFGFPVFSRLRGRGRERQMHRCIECRERE